MITLDQARERIGDGVIYTPPRPRGGGERTAAKEDGTITSVNGSYVFVRYAGRNNGVGVATPPQCLEFLVKVRTEATSLPSSRELSVREELAEITHTVCPADSAGRTHHLIPRGDSAHQLLRCAYCLKSSREILDEQERRNKING